MKMSNRIRTFTDKYPLVGPTFWIVSLQYFITQLIVAKAWDLPYSFSQNTISDLGNSACGVYSDRFVCSPLFAYMDASFIVLGATMIAGSTLIYQEFRKNTGNLVGFIFMALAGLGTMMVGIFSENENATLHALGAALPFLLGNVALLIFSYSLGLGRKFRYYTRLSALVALVALVFFVSKHYLGLGQGGMERLVAHPQTVWLILFGIYMSRNHFRKLAKRSAGSLNTSVSN
jgi:hypothetical membrane protein